MSVSITESSSGSYLHQEEEAAAAAAASSSSSYNHQYQYNNNMPSSISEIEEEGEASSELFEINHGGQPPMGTIREEMLEGISMFSLDVTSGVDQDCVYVPVGKSESSMDAVSWTLRNAVTDQSTMVYLVHIFPEVHHIPSPLGKLPKNQVSPEQVENYMAQERGKRTELLRKYINLCSASKVKVDTVLIESDSVAKAITDLIPILNMRKLVLGTSKSSLRKLRSRRGTGVVEQVLQNVPEYCELKIICDGKEVIDPMIGSPSPRNGNDENSNPRNMPTPLNQDVPHNDSFYCICFKSPRVM